MKGKTSQSYLHGAAILTAGTVAVKILGLLYKLPAANLLGDVGYSDFTVAYYIYAVLLTVSTAGLPVALSKMISEAGGGRAVKTVFSVAWFTFFCLGAAGTAVMALFPVQLAAVMGNAGAAPAIRALAPSVLLVCLLSAYRGYEQGHSNMRLTARTQILEAAVRLAVGLPLASLCLYRGQGLPAAAAGAITGVTASSAAALLYAVFGKRRMDRLRGTADGGREGAPAEVFRRLVRISVPIALGSSVMSVIDLVDSALLLNRMQGTLGYGRELAAALHGVYSKAQTVFNVPAAFAVPVAVSVIPAISRGLAARRSREAGKTVRSSLRITVLAAMPAAVGMAVLGKPMMEVLYPGSAEIGGTLLSVLGAASFFVCLTLVSIAVLQALSLEMVPIFTMLAGGGVKIALNWALIGIPSVNILGAPVGTFVCYALIGGANLLVIRRRMRKLCMVEPRCGTELPQTIAKTVLCSAAMGAAVRFLTLRLAAFSSAGRLRAALVLAAVILLGAAFYLLLIAVTGTVKREDVCLLPHGEKLAAVLRLK